MKIEKLTENKIRIVFNIEDLEQSNINVDTVLSNSPESQSLILSILNKAEEEVGFYAKDSAILVEAFSFPEGIFIFTITKSAPSGNDKCSSSYSYKKKPSAKRKSLRPNEKIAIYSFKNFDDFCGFCNVVNTEMSTNIGLKTFFKNTSLYFYNDTYYLIIYNFENGYKNLSLLFSILAEFANLVNNSRHFEAKLIEHGEVIFKKNAIAKTINIFFNKKQNL